MTRTMRWTGGVEGGGSVPVLLLVGAVVEAVVVVGLAFAEAVPAGAAAPAEEVEVLLSFEDV